MPRPDVGGDDEDLPRTSLYFVRLGTLGFGGPIALVGAMRRDLVERRRWVSETDYGEGLALSAAVVLPRCGSDAGAPVTYQPPQRSASGLS